MLRKSFVIISLTFVLSAFSHAWDTSNDQLLKSSQSKYFMHTGFMFDAVLNTAIFSLNVLTPVRAVVEHPIEFNNKKILPEGTKFIGVCHVDKSIDKKNARVNITFYTMVFPNGKEVSIDAMALHTDGSGGVPGKKVDTHKQGTTANILLGTIAATAQASTSDPLMSNTIATSSKEFMQDVEEKQYFSVTVPKNTPIQMYINRRIEY